MSLCEAKWKKKENQSNQVTKAQWKIKKYEH